MNRPKLTFPDGGRNAPPSHLDIKPFKPTPFIIPNYFHYRVMPDGKVFKDTKPLRMDRHDRSKTI